MLYTVHISLEELRTLLTSKNITEMRSDTRVQYLNFFLGPTVVNFSTTYLLSEITLAES
jgi:hypothetical protein